MADRILTQRALNRALLARQLLLERATMSIEDAVEQVGGLQTQYAPSGYVGLWTRLAGFRRDALTSALEDRAVIQATLMRTTIHMVSRREFWRYAAGVRQARRAWALRTPGQAAGEAAMIDAARKMREALADGPRTVKELGELGAASSAASASGSILSGCRHRGHGIVGERTGSASRRTGSVRATRRRIRALPTSSGPTCAASALRRGETSRRGRESRSALLGEVQRG
jgi:hypothetical protein